MNAKSPLAPVEHMLDCAKLAISYVGALAQEHPDFTKNHPETPWRSMTAMRNRIAHGYFELDLDIVRDTVLTALPELVYRLQPIRDEIAAPGGPRESSPSDEI
jgi:uncharacterized protein with HEPN domain